MSTDFNVFKDILNTGADAAARVLGTLTERDNAAAERDLRRSLTDSVAKLFDAQATRIRNPVPMPLPMQGQDPGGIQINTGTAILIGAGILGTVLLFKVLD